MAPWTPSELPTWFWSVVDEGHGDKTRLRAALARLPDEKLVEFQYWLEEAIGELPTDDHEDLLADAGLTSDEHLDDWASAIVWQGKREYERVFRNPEGMPPVADVDKMPNLAGVPGDLYFERTGGNILQASSRLRDRLEQPSAPSSRVADEPSKPSRKKPSKKNPSKKNPSKKNPSKRRK